MFEGFPYFGIWASKDAPFVCLEPWCGIADNIHHDYQLINKEGINRLAAGETWRRRWSVQLF
jgi:galactose mutarotase-like enzyme